MSSKELPDELIIEILSWLPAKSLLRLRCVSKSWRSSIDSPEFIKSHLFQNRTREISVFHVPDDGCYPSDPTSLILNFAGFDLVKGSTLLKFKVKTPLSRSYMHGVRLVGSCEGLICYRITSSSNRIVVVNPLTREDYFLSPPNTCNPCGFSDIGFGYDQITDGYKVVFMKRSPDGGNDVDVNIYDFKSKNWIKYMKFPWNYNNCIVSSWNACCINGDIHWLMQDRFLGFKSFHIVTFDLATEKLMVAEYDGEIFGYPTSVSLRILGGHLSLCCKRSRGDKDIDVDIWMMKEYGVKESWSKFVSFEDRDLMPLVLSNCGRRLLVDLNSYCRCCCGLHWYDLDNKSFQCTDAGKASEASGFYYVCLHSLIRLKKC